MIILIKFIVIPVTLGFVGYGALSLFTEGALGIPTSYNEVITLLILIGSTFAATVLSSGRAKPQTPDRETGTVKWFNTKKGFGFILCDQGDEIFVHYRSIEKQQGRQFIEQGQRVSFITTTNSKGLQADKVCVI